MGSEIENPPRRIVDVTKPWKSQFFECREIAKTPALNHAGFWDKPKHGLPTKEKGDR
jgi:hypothetical protein